jgi:hypothetical protein
VGHSVLEVASTGTGGHPRLRGSLLGKLHLHLLVRRLRAGHPLRHRPVPLRAAEGGGGVVGAGDGGTRAGGGAHAWVW